MAIREIVNFLIEWEYSDETYLDITYATLSLLEKDKACLYAYANSYGPFIMHLLEVYGNKQKYNPAKYLIRSDRATVDCGMDSSVRWDIIKEVIHVPTNFEEALYALQHNLKLIRVKNAKVFPYPVEALGGLAEYYVDKDLQKLLDCVTNTVVYPINATRLYYMNQDKVVLQNMLGMLDSLVTIDPYDVRWVRRRIEECM